MAKPASWQTGRGGGGERGEGERRGGGGGEGERGEGGGEEGGGEGGGGGGRGQQERCGGGGGGGQGLLARHRELCCGLRSTYHINLDHALGPATMAVLDPVLQAAGGTAEVGFRHEDQGGKLLRPQPVAYL